MDDSVSQHIQSNSRIGSIDAVRAIVLLGILIVHTQGGFGFHLDHLNSAFDTYLNLGIGKFLSHKCAVVFNVLFGVSFYFILKKPQYSSWKFVWRCVILFGFGLINKIFYTYDALCWYAIWGMILVAFRRCKPITLLFFAILLKLLAYKIGQWGVGSLCFSETMTRYSFDNSFVQILTYPYALVDYLRIVCDGGVVGCLSNFLIGYSIARAGIIDKINQLVTIRVVCAAIVLTVTLFASFAGGGKPGYYNLLFGLSYAIVVIFLYNQTKYIHRLLQYLESYGKLGLTNYSMQSIIGVSITYIFRNTMIVQHLSLLLVIMLLVYVLQAVFSHWWLETHKYGPLEYVWRSLTDRQFKGNKL